MTAEAAAFAAPVTKAERAARLRVVAGWLWSGALLAVLTFLVLYPVAMPVSYTHLTLPTNREV